MIKFKRNIELTIVTGYDEESDNITDETTILFLKGEIIDGDVIDEDGDYCDIEFSNGVAFGVSKTAFKIVE